MSWREGGEEDDQVEDVNMLDGKVDDGICPENGWYVKLLPAGTGQMVFYETFVH